MEEQFCVSSSTLTKHEDIERFAYWLAENITYIQFVELYKIMKEMIPND